MPVEKNAVAHSYFNQEAQLPYELRLKDFEMAMENVYDFFYDVNSKFGSKVLREPCHMLPTSVMS